MDAGQLRELIVRPTLKYLDPEIPYSIEAEDLLVGTACAESRCGHYIKQLRGPALGIFQMEPATETDNGVNFLYYPGRLKLSDKVDALIGESGCYSLGLRGGFVSSLIHPHYACAQARVKYYRDKHPIPKKGTNSSGYYLYDLGEYWKRVYNTVFGKGTASGFVEKCTKYGDFT